MSELGAQISGDARISPGAKIGDGTAIRAGAVVGPEVVLGRGNLICENAVLTGSVEIGNKNIIGSGAVIGGGSRQRLRPDKRSPDLGSGVVSIGDNNLIFECVTIHAAVVSTTRIENWTSLGAHTHVGHDATIRSRAVISVNVSVGGYAILGERVNVGLGVTIHPRVVIGALAMLGLGAAVTRHVRPGATVVGVPALYLQPNSRGVERAGLGGEHQKALAAYLNMMAEPTVEPLRKWTLDFSEDCRQWKRQRTPIPW